MIKISSFYPFQNLLRVTHEFYDDKVCVKTKSLNSEQEFDFDYKDVAEISDSFHSNGHQTDFGFWLLLVSAFLMALFCRPIYANPILLLLGQIFYLGGIFLYFAGFKKSWWFYFLDSSSNTISFIKQTSKNRTKISQVIELIKSKSDAVAEISAVDPFPGNEALFEHKYYHYSYFLQSTDKFYEDEIVGHQKGFFEESIYRISYSRLTGKIHHAKRRIELWGWTLTLATLVSGIIVGFYFAFGIKFGMTFSHNYLYPLYALYGIFLASLPFGLIKREVIGLYDKSGKIAYWAFVSKSEKEKVEKIIEFIRSKVSSEEKK